MADWPTRSIVSSSVDAGRISAALNRLGGTPGSYSLTWTEAELTSYLGSIVPAGDNVIIWCEPDELYIKYHTLALGGHTLRVRTSPFLSANQLQFEITGAWFDQQRLGSGFTSALQSMLNDILVDSMGQYRLQEFTVEIGQLRIRGELD